MSWPWWLVRPRLGVVFGGGATLGAFEVGVIDTFARRGVIPDLLVGTSVGAINASFWALDPTPDVGTRLLEFWLRCDRSTIFPDGPVPMVGRLLQRRSHLTTQARLARAVDTAVPRGTTFEDTRVPIAMTATLAEDGSRVVMRSGPLAPAILASAAIPGLWPPVAVDRRELFDGSLVANCDLQAAVEGGMTDVILVDLVGDGLHVASLDLERVIERSIAVVLRRQTELGLIAFGRDVRVAVLRLGLAAGPRFGDFSFTKTLFEAGRTAADEFLTRHLGPRRSVVPGVFEVNLPLQTTALDSGLRAASA